MPHGSPDYGEYAAFETIGRLVDLGELAVRLGSSVFFNREGNVVFQDNCEYTPLKWITDVAGANSVIKYSNDQVYSGGQSLKMLAGDSDLDNAGMYRYFKTLGAARIGFEFSFTVSNTKHELDFYVRQFDGHEYIMGNIILDYEDKKIYLVPAVGPDIVVEADFELAAYDHLFHTAKLVIDLKTGKYVRLIVDRTEYDLTAYALYTHESDVLPMLQTTLMLVTNEAADSTIYVDNMIITENEP